MELAKEKENSIKAKEFSKASLIFATIYVVVMPIVSNAFQWALSVDDCCKVALTVVAIWSPISISNWIDKFVGGKN